MFNLSMSYETGFAVHMALTLAILSLYMGHVGYCLFLNFIRDINSFKYEGAKKPWNIFNLKYSSYETGYFELLFITPVGIGGVGFCASFLWPILWPLVCLLLAAFGIRKVYRFKRKMKELLGSKADKDHTHIKE